MCAIPRAPPPDRTRQMRGRVEPAALGASGAAGGPGKAFGNTLGGDGVCAQAMLQLAISAPASPSRKRRVPMMGR